MNDLNLFFKIKKIKIGIIKIQDYYYKTFIQLFIVF